IVRTPDFKRADARIIYRHSFCFRSALLEALFEFCEAAGRYVGPRLELRRRRWDALRWIRTVVTSRQPFIHSKHRNANPMLSGSDLRSQFRDLASQFLAIDLE